MFALIVFDADFDLPQNLLIDLADRSTKRPYRGRSVEIKHVEEILVCEVGAGLQAASGQDGVGDADGGGISESNSDVEIIILFQEGVRNDVEDVPLICVPVFIRKLGGDPLYLPFDAAIARNLITALQHGAHGVLMLRAVFPQLDGAGVGPCAGV
ncbi:MAG: hypothetical protein IJQ32_07780 [Paludibacteraceae bacterium]|nr:hypothetical protein [Paludibacteraceae bacterium]